MVDFLDPNGNNTSNWNLFDFNRFDLGVRQPNVPETTNAVQTNSSDDNENQEYNMETVSITDKKITEIKIWTYGYKGATQPIPTVNIYFNGWKSSQNLSIPNGTVPADAAWISNTWVVDSETQAHIDGLLIRFTSGTMIKGVQIILYASYAEITTELLVVGPANIDKWNGINTINLVKWNGVNWSDLVKYNGID